MEVKKELIEGQERNKMYKIGPDLSQRLYMHATINNRTYVCATTIPLYPDHDFAKVKALNSKLVIRNEYR